MTPRTAKHEKIAIGTAQFGMPYGIANRNGQTPRDEAEKILSRAAEHGIDTLDTAINYGVSETTLGAIGVANWKVVSKLPAAPEDMLLPGWLINAVHGSLQRLKIDQLEALLLHRPEQLLGDHGEQLYAALCDARDNGLTRKIGVSVYTTDELARLTQAYHFDLIQAPLNIFDRGLIQSGWLQSLADKGVEVHTRSAFLQGLLLMPARSRPARFERWDDLWQRWDTWLRTSNTDPLAACIGYPLSLDAVAKVVVGVDSVTQLEEILNAAAQNRDLSIPDDLQCNDAQLINPALWPSP